MVNEYKAKLKQLNNLRRACFIAINNLPTFEALVISSLMCSLLCAICVFVFNMNLNLAAFLFIALVFSACYVDVLSKTSLLKLYDLLGSYVPLDITNFQHLQKLETDGNLKVKDILIFCNAERKQIEILSNKVPSKLEKARKVFVTRQYKQHD